MTSELSRDFPRQSIWSFLKSNLSQLPDRVCMIQSETGRAVTVSQLIQLTEDTTRGLRQWGLRHGQVVCMFCPNLVEYVPMYCAVTNLGAIFHACNWMFKQDELKYQLSQIAPVALVTVPHLLPVVEKAVRGFSVEIILITEEPVEGFTTMQDIVQLGKNGPVIELETNPKTTLSTIFFSSGTTGYPKGVQHTHFSIVASMHQLMLINFQDLPNGSERGVVLSFLPYFHIYAMGWVVLGSLIKARLLVVMAKFDMATYISLIHKYKPTHLHIVPSVAIGLVNNKGLQSRDVSHVRSIFSSAAPLSREIQTRLSGLFSNVNCIEQGYGMTEISGTHTSYRPQIKFGSVGCPHPGVEQKVVDNTTGEIMPPNQEGELLIRSPTQMVGYWRNPQATSAMLTEGKWVRTGDVAYIDEEGYLFITDRIKDIIRYQGEQVPPAELEDLILSHPAVEDVGVVGIPDTRAGELPMAFIKVKKGHNTSEMEISDFVAERVSGCKKLRGGVEFVTDIPRNASGKILRKELRLHSTKHPIMS